MTCIPFKAGNITGIFCTNTIHTYFDGKRTWRWEDTHYSGPWLVDRRGEPLKRQPGPRSKFWSIWQAANPVKESKP